MANVGFLGTGLLGSGMVERMLHQGTPVTVWNRTAAKAHALEPLGATVAATPGEAAAGADRIHMTLSDDAVVDEILKQIVPRLRKDAVVIDHSTTSPAGTKARVPRMNGAGVRFLHAPVFMSPRMTRDGTGIMLVSGPRAVFDEVRADLEKMTGRGLVHRRGARPRRRLQDFRQLDAVRHRRRRRRRIRDGERARHSAVGRARGLCEVPPGGCDQIARREDGARRFQRDLRADDGAQGHASDARGCRQQSDRCALRNRGAHGRRRSRRGAAGDLGAIAAEIVR